jgi:arginine:ornithine antiporter/lysine permease
MGNVAFATVMMSAVGYFIPIFKAGNNVPSIMVASVIAWSLTAIVNRGVESAAIFYAVITVCKLIHYSHLLSLQLSCLKAIYLLLIFGIT